VISATDRSLPDAPPTEAWTIDELAALIGLPVRTIREYQTLGLLPPPRRVGRIGLYGPGHVRRLHLVARLRDRGHSLAGIGDLLGNWTSGADLAEVLGVEPDQLVHVDEPGAPATLDQLHALVPSMVPDHLDALEATGVIERCDADAFCIPSPSLLQLVIDGTDAGLSTEDVLALLGAIRVAADTVADQVVQQLRHLPDDVGSRDAVAFLHRGRGLLAHGVGRLTIHRLARQLGIDTDADVDRAIRALVEGR
jgi:DNA-binding transcriptional MerR regulator